MSYIITVMAIDSRAGTPIAGAFVTITFRLAVDLPSPVPKTGTTGIDGRVSWTTAREGIADVTATHTDYDDWRSIFNFSPTNPTANIFMQSLAGPVRSVKRISCTDDATGLPIVDMRVTANWAGVGGRFLEGKTTDNNGEVFFEYWPSWSGTFDTSFKLPWPTPLISLSIFYPPAGGDEALAFALKMPETDEEIEEAVEEAWKPWTRESLSHSIIIALSIIYGMRALQGFSAARFKPI